MGLCFYYSGIGLIGNIFGLWNFSLFFNGWWTLLLIIPGVISMVQYGVNAANGALVLIGAFFLLEAQRVLPPGFLFKIILPVLLVVIGLSIIFGGHRHDNDSDRSHVNRDIKMDFDKKPYYDAVFSRNSVKNTAEDLIGGGVSSVFGKMDLDMRGAKLTRDTVFEVNAICGKAIVAAPLNVRIRTIGTPVIGSVCDRTGNPNANPDAPQITFTCNSIFGVIEII